MSSDKIIGLNPVYTNTPADQQLPEPAIPTFQKFLSMIRSRNLSRTNRFLVDFALPPDLMGEFAGEAEYITMMCEEAAFPGKIIAPRPLRINGITENRASVADYMGDSITFQFMVDSSWLPRKVMERWMNLCVEGANTSREVGWYTDYISDIRLYALVPALPQLEGVEDNPTPSDRGYATGLGTGTAFENLLARAKRIGNDRLDKAKTQIGGYIDPRAVDVLRDTARILNVYHGGKDPNSHIPPEKAVWGMTLFEAWPRVINVQQTSYSSPGYHKMNVTFTYKYWESHLIEASNDAKSKAHSTALLDHINLDKLFPRIGR